MKKTKLLLNAEPFGFGPSAAIASLAPMLADKYSISYIGEKHTLDLQTGLNYAETYDTSDMTKTERKMLLEDLSAKYDFFISAMDFEMTEIAQEVGFKTIIYDALTWYWPEIHPAIYNTDLYVVQNFFGVEERINSETGLESKTKLISPPVREVKRRGKKYILLNLGGLQNPYWKFSEAVKYAEATITAVSTCTEESDNLIITTSSRITEALRDPRVVTLSRQEMLDTLSKTRLAIMTPGLGNIYDSASFDIPTLWLPPANDSQGQQSKLLLENNMCDEVIDWGDLVGDIDYKMSQLKALNHISGSVTKLATHRETQKMFAKLIKSKVDNLRMSDTSKSSNLIQLFGSSGTFELCEEVTNFIGVHSYANTK